MRVEGMPAAVINADNESKTYSEQQVAEIKANYENRINEIQNNHEHQINKLISQNRRRNIRKAANN